MALRAEGDCPDRALPVIHSRVEVSIVFDARLSSVGTVIRLRKRMPYEIVDFVEVLRESPGS
jgi:hypothetical protein